MIMGINLSSFIFLLVVVLLNYLRISSCDNNKESEDAQEEIGRASDVIDRSSAFQLWLHPTKKIPLFNSLYFFNVTNPEEVVRRGRKPIVQEVGPYVYQEVIENVIEKYNEDKSTVTYRRKTTYFFRQDLSKGRSLDELITTMNVPYIGIQKKLEKLGAIVNFLANNFLQRNGERLFIRKSVRQLTFEGYFQPSVAELSRLMGGKEILKDNKMGFFYGRNGSLAKPTEMYTGLNDSSSSSSSSLLGETVKWNGQEQLGFWSNSNNNGQCNILKGTDGTVFPPHLNKTLIRPIFDSRLCRSVDWAYEKDVVVSGVSGYRYIIPRKAMASPEENLENRCYCNERKYGDCLKTGVIRLSACRNDEPVVISWPHYWNADAEYYEKSIIGMNPDVARHGNYIDIEPKTGLILRQARRYQINIELKKSSRFQDMKLVANMLFPILWAETVQHNRSPE